VDKDDIVSSLWHCDRFELEMLTYAISHHIQETVVRVLPCTIDEIVDFDDYYGALSSFCLTPIRKDDEYVYTCRPNSGCNKAK